LAALFLSVMLCRSRKHQSELRLVLIRRFAQFCNRFYQGQVRPLGDQIQNLDRELFQRRNAPAARLRGGAPLLIPALQPLYRRRHADLETLCCLASRRTGLHSCDNALPQVTRIGLRHPSPHKRRINAQRLPHSEPAGNPTDSNKPGTALVRFQAYSSTSNGGSRAGEILSWSKGDFHPLPALQTIIRSAEPPPAGTNGALPVSLVARMNALGLLQISCISAAPGSQQSWPLEFNMRLHDEGGASVPGVRRSREATVQIEPNAAADALETARKQIGIAFAQPGSKSKKGKLTAGTILKSLEPIIGSPRSGWNGPLLRALWPALEERLDSRRLSVDHEEAWLIIAGFLLRPGFGVARDDLRIDVLWSLHDAGPCFPGRRIKSQEYILWRRVAGGLTRERQNKLLTGEVDRIYS